jgi:hypothetical protein
MVVVKHEYYTHKNVSYEGVKLHTMLHYSH